MLGILLGLLFGVWFAHDGTSLLAGVIYWTAIGAVIGALVALVDYALRRGRRNFASVVAMQPQRFDVLVDEAFAVEAASRLARFDLSHHRTG